MSYNAAGHWDALQPIPSRPAPALSLSDADYDLLSLLEAARQQLDVKRTPDLCIRLEVKISELAAAEMASVSQALTGAAIEQRAQEVRGLIEHGGTGRTSSDSLAALGADACADCRGTGLGEDTLPCATCQLGDRVDAILDEAGAVEDEESSDPAPAKAMKRYALSVVDGIPQIAEHPKGWYVKYADAMALRASSSEGAPS